MAAVGGVLGFLALALWVYCMVDAATTPSGQTQYLNKWLWFAIVAVLFPPLGAIAWLALGRPRRVPADVTGASGTGADVTPEPEPEKPRRRTGPTFVAPDDDADFLKRLDEITHLEQQAFDPDAPSDDEGDGGTRPDDGADPNR